MKVFIGIIIGLTIGAVIGFVLAALLSANKFDELREELARYRRQETERQKEEARKRFESEVEGE